MTKQVKLHENGYEIVVHSWENDADNHKVASYTVDTEEKAKDLVDFARLFSSHNNKKDGIGNYYEPDLRDIDHIDHVFKEFLSQHPLFFNGQPEQEVGDHYEWFFDVAYLLGLAGGEYYTRVCSNVKVYFHPEDIYAEDVTEKFI